MVGPFASCTVINTSSVSAEKHLNYKVYTFFRLLAYSGMRRGDVLALKWEDNDFKNSEITINRAIGQGKRQKLHAKSTKTGTTRTIIIKGIFF